MKNLIFLSLVLTMSVTSFATEPIPEEMNKRENAFLEKHIDYSLESDAHFLTITEKTQICFHVLPVADGDLSLDTMITANQVAPFVVTKDKIYNLFDTNYWGYHLGVKNGNLNRISIPIKIQTFGELKLIDGDFRAFPNDYGQGSNLDSLGNVVKVVINPSDVVEDSAGHYFHKLSIFQVKAVSVLCKHLAEKHDINLAYKDDMWKLNEDALNGTPGIYTHSSYRSDKVGLYPQKELIASIQNLG